MARQKKRADGLYKVSATASDGKRIYGYGKTQKEAKEKLVLKVEEHEKGIYRNARHLNFDQYFERWVSTREHTVTGNTMVTQDFRKRVVSNAVLKSGAKFGNINIVDITLTTMMELQAALLDLGYSTSYINSCTCLAGQVLEMAVIDDAIQKNPARYLKNLKRTERKATDTIHRALTIEETEKFLEASKNSWYYDFFRFMLYSGCRLGEVCALKRTDIDEINKWIRIERTKTNDRNLKVVIGESTKTDSGKRKIPLTDDLAEIIDSQLQKNYMVFGLDQPEYIFSSSKGTIPRTGSINGVIANMAESIGIEKISSHAFRDTFATRCIESGMNPKTLQEILGHSDISMTMNIYAHVMENTKQEEMKNLKIM